LQLPLTCYKHSFPCVHDTVAQFQSLWQAAGQFKPRPQPGCSRVIQRPNQTICKSMAVVRRKVTQSLQHGTQYWNTASLGHQHNQQAGRGQHGDWVAQHTVLLAPSLLLYKLCLSAAEASACQLQQRFAYRTKLLHLLPFTKVTAAGAPNSEC
jgi:hypothetical protein